MLTDLDLDLVGPPNSAQAASPAVSLTYRKHNNLILDVSFKRNPLF